MKISDIVQFLLPFTFITVVVADDCKTRLNYCGKTYSILDMICFHHVDLCDRVDGKS